MNRAITYEPEERIFHIAGKTFSYILQIYREGYLAHIHWGRKIRSYNGTKGLRFMDRGFSPNPDPEDRTFSLDTLPQEYPAYGNTDFRVPAFRVEFPDGSTVTDLRYKGHAIFAGKKALEGLPALYAEEGDHVETLEVTMEDTLLPLRVVLSYTVFKDHDVLTRSARIVNGSGETLKLLDALSVNVDFRKDGFDMLQFSGAHIRERHLVRRSLEMGQTSIESRRGASSHQQNPFLVLVEKGTTETQGEAYGINLVYSGNFIGQAEVDQFHTTRVSMGINPFEFSWMLEPGEAFQTPEAVLAYSGEGLGALSRTLHKAYRQRLARGRFRDKERPVLVNNWEATYFDFDQEKIYEIAKMAASTGIELMVLDDGWFGKRDDDRRALGDWTVNGEKLQGGLDALARRVRDEGVQFGLWFEPEMVSEDSDLYRDHPDWCIHVPSRNRSTGRSQLVLDLTRKEVRENVVEQVRRILAGAPITYVKWDMNRHMTEVHSLSQPPDRQKETAHRYMLGLYEMMEVLTGEFPHILFESCSGGGGRFDPGMLHYMPQTWTSDDTDAVERLKIQYGTSMAYPAVSMGAHVSEVPNHQVHRTTSMKMRGDVAMAGNLGYELDITKSSEADLEAIREQVSFYKGIRGLVQFGDLYRLASPFEGNETAWMFVSEDKRAACVFWYKVLGAPQEPFRNLRLEGLEEGADYTVTASGGEMPPLRAGGDELMGVGIPLPMLEGDFKSCAFLLEAKA
ncbi:alpha-galactosidase [Clostridiales bacterium F-3ap]|uniref:Alpha-galactosidase n=2 Tax=Anaerotalea alkaliphila TaxID=2662126 RepID=A0A7X5HVG3_9FIRM|nr:alpha-galactosidase [Anaerotalea alkaliphila]